MCSLLLHWSAELPQEVTCPRVKKVPAPDYSTRLRTAPSTELRWLFTAWVQLLVFKDTVALFGISLDFGAFTKNCHQDKFLQPSIHWFVNAVETAPESLPLQPHCEVLPSEP